MALPQVPGASLVQATGLWLQPQTAQEHISYLFSCTHRMPGSQEAIHCPK